MWANFAIINRLIQLQMSDEEDQQTGVHKDEETQQILNAPMAKEDSLHSEDEEFLKLLIRMIDEGKIGLHQPSSLINREVYDKLDEQTQGKVDMEAMNLLNAIRNIKNLHDSGFHNTYQIENMVETLKATKERLEQEGGDLFII